MLERRKLDSGGEMAEKGESKRDELVVLLLTFDIEALVMANRS